MHIGNYFGAVRNWVELQEKYQCVYGVVDLHAMTRQYDPAELRENSRRMIIELLACGIDPQKSTMFIQSMVPEHSELCWILSCFCAHGKLERMTQFKDKVRSIEDEGQAEEFVSAGLLFYPILQAADILVYRASFVPVGKDQEQHLELSRDIARRFNQRFGVEFFPEPQPLFSETPKIMSLVDPEKKMSKSDKAGGERNYVGLFEDPEKIRKKVRSAVTDSGDKPAGGMSPGVGNLFEILQACGKTDVAASLQKDHDAGTLRYSDLKNAVADALVELTSELRRRRDEFTADEATVDKHIREMTEKARTLARETMREVRRLTGLPKM
jgi:tryptophanyl-tRNA synthetase